MEDPVPELTPEEKPDLNETAEAQADAAAVDPPAPPDAPTAASEITGDEAALPPADMLAALDAEPNALAATTPEANPPPVSDIVAEAPAPFAVPPVPPAYTQAIDPPPAAPVAVAPPASGQPSWASTLLAIFFALFVVGGLYFGYLFYQTVRDVTAYYSLPEPVIIPTRPAEAGGAAVAAPTATPPPVPTAAPQSPAAGPVWNRKGRVNMLLLGTDDGRRCVDGVPRTDTIILVSLDTETKQAAMISIPRDLWVEIPSRGIAGIPTEQRINTAYTFGEVNRYPGGGAKLVRDTVEKNFGQPIHYHAIVNLNNMKEIVDLLGGVDIEVTERLYDTEFPTDDCGYRTIDFKPGMHHMNGEDALAYARSRYTTSDFDRSTRQQQLLLAIRRRALQPDVVTKLPALIGQYRNLVRTDMSLIEMLGLANIAKDIEPASIERRAIDVGMVYPWVRPDGAQVLLPDRAKIKTLFDQIFNPSGPASN